MPVVVEGVVGFRKALNAYAPALRKEMDKDIRNALKPIIADARSKVKPVSILNNWNKPIKERESRTGRAAAFPSYDPQVVRRGLVYSLAKSKTSKSGFISLFSLLNKSAVGAIIETAGRLDSDGSSRSQSNNPDAGRRFILAMNQFGTLTDYAGRGKITTGRLLYAAYERNQGRAIAAVHEALAAAKKAFETTAHTQDRIKRIA